MSETRAFAVARADSRTEQAYAVLRGQKGDLLLTDPPYCLLTRRRKSGDLRQKRNRKIDRDPVTRFETVSEYRAFTEAWLSASVKHLVPSAPLVIWTNVLGRDPIASVARRLGYPCRWGEFVWAKRTTDRVGNEQSLRVYEVALVFGTESLAPPLLSDPPRTWAVVAGYDEDGDATAWGNHPNHKPFSVVEPLVRAFSRPGQLILDPFAGSGSIAAAALRLGRRAATIELDSAWAQRVERRLESIPMARER